MNWYQMETQELLRKLSCPSDRGLSTNEVQKRKKEYGPNELEQEKGPGILRQFAAQFKDFMILTLLAAALISFLASYLKGEMDLTDPVIILAIVVINALLGIFQERKAEHSLAHLRSLQTPECHVLRDGARQTISSPELVPGDIVYLDTGCLVPADGRLLTARNLTVEESALTGETGGVDKSPGVLTAPELSPGDQTNMVFSGTMVTTGNGLFCVTDIGMNTQIGHIAGMLSREEAPETPLTRRLNHTGKVLGILALAVCAVIFIIGIRKNQPVFEMFMTSVSLGVAAIPESLPALVTIMLSLGVERMAKQRAIIRHLPAVETLGSASVICSDKTGTLTENRMTVRTTFCLDQEKTLLRHFLLCNNQTGPLEEALISYAAGLRLDYGKVRKESPCVHEIPFDSERKRMTTLHRTPHGYLSVTKGAPELILSRCSSYYEQGKILPMTAPMRSRLTEQAEQFATQALRVIAIAFRTFESKQTGNCLEEQLTFLGMAGLMDPPRPEAYAAVKSCRRAGIQPVMITGDHRNTAAAIGKELGICRGEEEVISGQELDRITDSSLPAALERYHVFARVSPAHKVRLVKGYQAMGNVVAMTGDGVNDAPALKAADIGCAMGQTGTDVAKNAADIILMDDNFSTIVSAVKEGRGIYDNIKKAIHFLLSCNIGEIMTIFVAIFFGLPAPLLPVQLLFINLVTDSFPALCLGVEPPDPDSMSRPPLPKNSGIFHFDTVFQMVIEGLFIGSLALFAYTSGNSTMCFAVLSLSQLIHSFNMRSEHSLLETGITGNKKLLFSVLLCIALQCCVICVPALQAIFHTQALCLREWIVVGILSLMPIPLMEISKRLH